MHNHVELHRRANTSFLLLLFTFGIYMWDRFLPAYIESFGINKFQIGLIYGIATLFYVFNAPLIGKFSDKFGRKKIMIIGLIGSIIGYTLYYFGNSFWIFVLAQIIDCLSYIAVFHVAIFAIEDKIRGKSRGYQTGKAFATIALIKLISPLIGGFFADAIFIKAPLLFAIFVQIILLIIVLTIREKRKKPMRIKVTDFNYWGGIKKFIQHKKLRWVGIGGFFFLMNMTAIAVFVPLLIIDKLHLSYGFIGLFFACLVAPSLLQSYMGRATDRGGRLLAITLGMVVFGLCMYLITQTTNPLLILAYALILGAADAWISVSAWSMMSDYGEQTHTEGQTIGSYLSVSRLGSFTGQVAGGFIAFNLSIDAAFKIFSIMLIIMGVMFYLATKNLPKIPQK